MVYVKLNTCAKCDEVKILMLKVDLPQSLIQNINSYYQCSECDQHYKHYLKKQKRKIYYEANKFWIRERISCTNILKLASISPINTVIVIEMILRLKTLKSKNIEAYEQVLHDFTTTFNNSNI